MKAIAQKLVKIQALLAPAKKGGKNPHLKSRYATIENVLQAVLPVLEANNVALLQTHELCENDKQVRIKTHLIDADSGEFVISDCCIPMQKVDPQGFGSGTTYARRYALLTILGMETEDDDGHGASTSPKAKKIDEAAAALLGEGKRDEYKTRLANVKDMNELSAVAKEMGGADSPLIQPFRKELGDCYNAAKDRITGATS